MMHSMDFHAAMVSPQDKYRSIAPGQTIAFEFTPELPGRLHVPLRHADGARAHRLGHVRHGDRRAARRLSDQGRPRVRGHPERVLHQARSRRSARSTACRSTCSTASACARTARRTPCSTAVYNGMVDNPLPAKPGERVRLFVLNVGPSRTPRASTSSARSSTASGSTAIPTTSSAACRRCCSARRTARSSSS